MSSVLLAWTVILSYIKHRVSQMHTLQWSLPLTLLLIPYSEEHSFEHSSADIREVKNKVEKKLRNKV